MEGWLWYSFWEAYFRCHDGRKVYSVSLGEEGTFIVQKVKEKFVSCYSDGGVSRDTFDLGNPCGDLFYAIGRFDVV